MKSIAKLIVTFITLCPSALALAMGGISGGGGNVLPGRAPDGYQDPEIVEHRVRHSKLLAIQFLADAGDELAPVLDAAMRAQPDVEDNRPCVDYDGHAVDGSVFSDKPGHFCISALNLAKKVDYSEIPAQAAALMVHECAELAGASEEQAVALQSRALEALRQGN